MISRAGARTNRFRGDRLRMEDAEIGLRNVQNPKSRGCSVSSQSVSLGFFYGCATIFE